MTPLGISRINIPCFSLCFIPPSIDQDSSIIYLFLLRNQGQADELIEQTDVEDICSLQMMQWTVSQFSMAVLEKLVPCLKFADEQLFVHGLDLFNQMVMLLRESVLPGALWVDGSLPSSDLVSF